MAADEWVVVALQPCIVDVYAGDVSKDWATFCAAGPQWAGVIIKCSQGTYYRPPAYASERARFLAAAGPEHVEGAYHYIDLAIDGALQAEYAVVSAGVVHERTLPLMVDVERGGQRIADPSRQRVIDCVSGFADRYHTMTGRRATLYGGELLRAVGVGGLMGCGRSAVALYSKELHGTGESTAGFLRRTGTDLAHLALWQYRGTELQTVGPKGYPMTAPGCGIVDISAVVMPGGVAAMLA